LPSSTVLKDPRFSCRVGGLFCGVEGLILSGRLKDCCDCLRYDRLCMSDDIRLVGIRSDVSARGDGSSPTILCGRSVSSNNVGGAGMCESCLAFAAAALRSGSLAATASFRGDTDFGSGDIWPVVGESVPAFKDGCGLICAAKFGRGSFSSFLLVSGMAVRLRATALAYDERLRYGDFGSLLSVEDSEPPLMVSSEGGEPQSEFVREDPIVVAIVE